MTRKHILAFALAAGALAAPISLHSKPQPKCATGSGKAQTANAQGANAPQDQGQKIFDRNCSRCHNAPEGFSPRISGTIVRHMRTRANLSEQDEKELLKFFNP